MDRPRITHWLVVQPGTDYLPFAELAHRIALTLWPDRPGSDDEEMGGSPKYAGARINLESELPEAVKAGRLKLCDPLTHGDHPDPTGAGLRSGVVAIPHLRDYLAPRGVGVPLHFVTAARPRSVPADLLTLAPDSPVTYEKCIGRERGSGITNAGDYLDGVRNTIERQADGYFTLNEGAQVLADNLHRLDPIEIVKRFRLAHSKGELPIHAHGSRFRLEVGETIRDFLDLLEVAELDAWLRASAGYGFPNFAAAPVDTAEVLALAPKAARPMRKTWRDVAWDYMVQRMRTGSFATATELNHALHNEAGAGLSPFDKGEGQHRGKLWVREIAQPLSLKTIQNNWADLRAALRAV